MKLTKNDIALLVKLDVSEEDFKQIEHSMAKTRTKYTMDQDNGPAPVEQEDVIALCGREAWLTGLVRSAFHRTASITTKDGREVIFETNWPK